MERLKKLKRMVLYAGLGKSDFRRIRKDLTEDNKRSLVFCSALSCVFMAVLFVLSFFLEAAREKRWLYLGVMCAIAVVYLVARYGHLKEKGVYFCIYILWSIYMAMGIYLGAVATPDQYAVTYVALVLAVPLLFSDMPIRIGIFIGFYAVAFIVCSIFFESPAVRSADIVHAILFSTISVIVSYNAQKIRFQRHLLAYQMRVLSETDLLTGIRNRNAFETAKKRYTDHCTSSVSCVYIDANGLHELNNVEGHHRGDEMLRLIADSLYKQFGIENVYRIGGDEFVAFAVDEDLSSVEQKSDEIRRTIEDQGYFISLGVERQTADVLDIDALVRHAEEKMYDDKTQYYASRGDQRERTSFPQD